MKFIKLTSVRNGIIYHINPEWITHINEAEPGVKTAVYIHGEDGSTLVKETPEQILSLIQS